MKHLLTLIFALTVSIANAENRQPAIDSLLSLLHTTTGTHRVDVMNELSMEYGKMDSNVTAIKYALQARTLSEQEKYNKGTGISLSREAIIYHQQGDYAKALELYLKSLKIAEQVRDSVTMFMINNNIGMVYYYQQEYEQALKYYRKAEQNNINPGLTYSNMGMLFTDKNDYTTALSYFTKALGNYYTSANQNGISSMLSNIGNIYENKGEYEKALDYYTKSLSIKQQIGDNQGEADALGSIGDVYYALKDYNTAIDYENRSLHVATRIGYLISAQQTHEVLSTIYESMGNTTHALKHYKQYITLRDSLYNEENTKRTVRAQMNYEFDKTQERVHAEQEKKDAVNKTIIYSVSGGLAVALLLSIFIFAQYRQKKLANVTISEQKRVIEEKQKEVLASIRYAQRIQQALMPTEIYINKSLVRLNKVA